MIRKDECISVGELIVHLKNYDPLLPVMVYNPDDGSFYEPDVGLNPADRIFNPATGIMVVIK